MQPVDPTLEQLVELFDYKYLPESLKPTAEMFKLFALDLIQKLPTNKESLAALCKLLEAKDCAVRAHLPK